MYNHIIFISTRAVILVNLLHILETIIVVAVVQPIYLLFVRRCGVMGSTLTFGSIGHGFESEHRLFSHHSASAFSKLRSLAKCLLDDSVRRLL